MPTVSGTSNHDSVDCLELPAEAGPYSSSEAEAEAAHTPTVPSAAESDNEADNSCVSDEPTPKFRKLSCSEPPPSVRVSKQLQGWCWEVLMHAGFVWLGVADFCMILRQ
jgi:hypothetical protein